MSAVTLCSASNLHDDAGRAAYLAAFHAAQAIIFERTGRVVKTHRGVQSEFLRLTKDDPVFTPDQRIFLSQAYNFKFVADYETGPGGFYSERDSPLPGAFAKRKMIVPSIISVLLLAKIANSAALNLVASTQREIQSHANA